MRRVENVGMERGDIEDIVFEDLYAENCHTVIRLLSFDHAIRRIAIRNVTAGFRCYAVNMDAARYCATPLFDDRDWPQGVGCIEDVSIRDFTAWTDGEMPAVKIETNCRGFSMENFRFRGGSNALEAHNLAPSRLTVDGKAHKVHGKDELFVRKDFSSLRADPLG